MSTDPTTPTTAERSVDLIRAHAMHESRFTPNSVHVRDKLFLLAEIDRLREELADLQERAADAAEARDRASE